MSIYHMAKGGSEKNICRRYSIGWRQDHCPLESRVHFGGVYLNGRAFYEAASLKKVLSPGRRDICSLWTWGSGACYRGLKNDKL